MFTNLTFSLPFLIPILIITIDHAIRHDGKFIDFTDFKIAVLSSLKSHEGWIFMILLVFIGFCIGGLV